MDKETAKALLGEEKFESVMADMDIVEAFIKTHYDDFPRNLNREALSFFVVTLLKLYGLGYLEIISILESTHKAVTIKSLIETGEETPDEHS